MIDNIEFVKVKEGIPGKTCDSYDCRILVDIQLGETVYKDAVITISENTLKHIVWKFETRCGDGY